jgi:predicted nucleic acid-binding protein
LSRAGFSRSFLNDVLLAVSCREAGAVLITANVADFARIRTVESFRFMEPWPPR